MLPAGSEGRAEAVCGQNQNTKRSIHPGAGGPGGDLEEPCPADRGGRMQPFAGGHVPDRPGAGCVGDRFIFL